MKTKVAFISKKMDTGGIEKAVIEIFNQLDPNRFDIDYYYRRRLHEKVGILTKCIPEWIIKKEIEIPTKNNYRQYFFSVRQIVRFLFYYGLSYLGRNSDEAVQYSLQAKMGIKKNANYDIAIAFDGPKAYGVFYTAENICANKKVLWIHGDVEKEAATTKLVEKYYNSYDYIVTVSEEAKKILLRTFPRLKNKVKVVYNYVNYLDIKQKAAVIMQTPFDGYRGLKIVTVGRLGEDKGMLMAAQCCKKLVESHINVCWVLCGDGPERNRIETFILDNHLENNFIIVGNQTNPYAFMMACDIYVQPSIREGFCTTTNEAKVLCKPVIATNVCGMREQFENGVNGMIVDISPDAIFNGIKVLVEHPEIREQYSTALKRYDWGQQVDYNKLLEDILDGTFN